MKHTVFDTPWISPMMRWVARGFLWATGWHTEGRPPALPKYVIIGAYHTSNWDFPFAIAFGFAFDIRFQWMGKHTLFRWPFRRFFLWLGGIPVERERAHGVVAASIRAFQENEQLVVIITPEGTRKKVDQWKMGFYHIAMGAGVPISLGYLDFKRKVGGFGPLLTPSGDVAADMAKILDFYRYITPKYPELGAGPVPAPRP